MWPQTDIDIDVADRRAALATMSHVAAVRQDNGRRQRHPSGVYFQDIPVDPLDGMAAYDYETAAQLGYFKLDVLSAPTVYGGVRDPAHLAALVAREPLWDAFDDPDIVSRLTQVGNHFDVVQAVRPRSVLDLALVLALVRPGKRHLIGRPRTEIEAAIWQPDPRGYVYKKSHAVAYALGVVVQLNLMTEAAEAAPA